MSRHFFPGGNTPTGFFSFFSYISWRGERTIHLKGSSGCGKSTFMKKAAAAFESIGFEAERFHCSNDAESLDGVCIPKAGVSIIDGTAPHVSDPAIPAAHDEIFNMADFIDQKSVIKYKDELSGLSRRKKEHFDRAYGYLASARAVYRNNEDIYSRTLDHAKLNASIIQMLGGFDGVSKPGSAGRNRKLFASAITPDGPVSYADSLTGAKTVYVLMGETGSGTDIFLEKAREAANLRGFDSESLYCPLNVNKLEHLIIPDLDLCFTTQNKYHAAKCQNISCEIDFADFLDRDAVTQCREEIEDNGAIFEGLIGKAVEALAAQRLLHERIEEIYAPAVDFGRLTLACDEIIARLLKDATFN